MQATMISKDVLFEAVCGHLVAAVDGLQVDQIDATRSMKDVGANSLDIVEVVSATMRQFRIKVPRSELGKLENIQGLVDLLHTAAQAKVS